MKALPTMARHRLGAFAFLAAATFLGATGYSNAASRVALVIGNGAYRNVRPLPNPPRDAADVSAALKRLNFSVTTLIDATAGEMRHELDDFGKAATDSEMAVVFYAGHGMEAAGKTG